MKFTNTTALSVLVITMVLLLNASIFSVSFGNAAVNSTNESVSSADLLQYEWSQFQGDSSFTRFSAGPAPNAPDILWEQNVTDIQPYISAFNGMIFVTTDTSVYALNRDSGSVIWHTAVPAIGQWPVVYKIDDAHMVVGSSCLNPQTGEILWVSNDFSACAEPLFNYNVYSPEEQMFYVKINSTVTAWNFAAPDRPPTAIWSTYVSGSGSVGSGVQYGDGKVFCGSFEAHQVALDAKSGALLWDTNTKASMVFSGTYSNGKFFRGGAHDNTFYAFDADTGEISWTYNPSTEDGYWCSGPAAAYGIVYALNKDGNIYALNQTNGDVIWKYTGPGDLMFPGTPTVADGKVYATTGQEEAFGGQHGASEFACLDAYTGRLIWKLPIEAFAPRESVAIAYGNLYLIPAGVTTAVDSLTGAEYSSINQIWAFSTTDWSMYRNDPTHSGVGQSGPTNLLLKWAFSAQGAIVSSPTIANGITYFGSQDKNIYAVNAANGDLIWKFVTQARIGSSPAVVNGRLYTGADDGYVYCLDAYNGNLIWKSFAGGYIDINLNAVVQLRSSPTVVGGVVYVGALDNKTYAFNTDTGDVIWSYSTQGPITSSPAVVDGAVYITAQDPTSGTVYKLNAADGALIWAKAVPYMITLGGGHDIYESPVVAAGLVFVSSNCAPYYALNASTGDTVWTYGDPAARQFIISSPIYVNGQVILVDHFAITCVNAQTGDLTWSSFLGDELYVSPTYGDNKVYVITDQRHLFVINATNGEKLSSYSFDSNSWSSPTLYEGNLYVGSNDWKVYCFTEATLNVPVPTPSSSTVTPTDTSGIETGDIPLVYVYIAIILAIVVVVSVAVAVVLYTRMKRKT
jgi:outer membrane protein assembly factor BamB